MNWVNRDIYILILDNLFLDNHEMYLLDDELLALSQEFISAMLLARQLGYSILIVIDGLDHLGDKCATSAKQVLIWFY